MSLRSKREYTETVFLRYKNASRKEKKLILNEFCATLGYHRKHTIRVLRNFKRFRKTQNKKPGRAPFCSQPQILKPLKKIWLTENLPCSKRLEAILPLWMPVYNQSFGPLTPEVSQALLQIYPATIDRILCPVRIHYKKRGRSTTKPGTLLRKQIPIQTNQWNESHPGFLDADTVAHCGDSLSGRFAYTIDFVDIPTGWTGQRAVWGKGETDVLQQIKDIEIPLPFPSSASTPITAPNSSTTTSSDTSPKKAIHPVDPQPPLPPNMRSNYWYTSCHGFQQWQRSTFSSPTQNINIQNS